MLTHHHRLTKRRDAEHWTAWVRQTVGESFEGKATAQTSALRGERWAIFISGESANNSQRLRIWVSSKVAQHKVTISSRYRTLAIQFGVNCLKQPSYVKCQWWWTMKDTVKLLISYITQTWLASWLFISSLSTATQYRGILSGGYEVLTDLIVGGRFLPRYDFVQLGRYVPMIWRIASTNLRGVADESIVLRAPNDIGCYRKQTPTSNVILSSTVVISRRPGWRSHYSDSLRGGRTGIWIPVDAIFSATVETGPGSHPASFAMGNGSLSLGLRGRSVAFTSHPHIAPMGNVTFQVDCYHFFTSVYTWGTNFTTRVLIPLF